MSSKASNPTRPQASSEDVLRRLKNLNPKKRRFLVDWGYPIEGLEQIAADPDRADSVDALLAIMTERQGYEYDDGDLKKANRIARALKADGPEAWLEYRKKKPEATGSNFQTGVYTDKQGEAHFAKSTWKTTAVGISICLGVIVLIVLLVTLFK